MASYSTHFAWEIRGGSRIFERGGSISGADTGFPEGGGGEDIHKHPPPWTLSAWHHPPSEKLKNTPTLGHSQAPPPLHIARVTSPTFTPVTPPPPWIRRCILGLQAKKGGSNFGPNVKKPTSWPKRGGGPDPPPRIRYWKWGISCGTPVGQPRPSFPCANLHPTQSIWPTTFTAYKQKHTLQDRILW